MMSADAPPLRRRRSLRLAFAGGDEEQEREQESARDGSFAASSSEERDGGCVLGAGEHLFGTGGRGFAQKTARPPAPLEIPPAQEPNTVQGGGSSPAASPTSPSDGKPGKSRRAARPPLSPLFIENRAGARDSYLRDVVLRPLRLYSFHELPRFLQDNNYILTGYRVHTSFEENWWSLFKVHNEVGNIWTHLLGALMFVYLSVTTPHTYPQYSAATNMLGWNMDYFFIQVSLIGSALCLAFSAIFHTHYCHSAKVHIKLSTLDQCGISFMIGGSALSLVYFILYCWDQTWWRWLWMSVVVMLNLTGIIGPYFPVWITPEFRRARTLIFVGSGGIALLPVMHYWTAFTPAIFDSAPIALAMVQMCALFVGGAAIYVTRIPERWAPGKFDIWCQSHQIWHLAVVAGGYMHYKLLFMILDHRNAASCAL